MRATHPVVWSCVVALSTGACASSKPPGSSAASAGADASSVAGSLSLNGPKLGTDGTGGADASDTCAGELIQAERTPLDMYVMLDASGSMLDATASDPEVTKWQAVSSALTGFMQDPQSEGIGIGLQVFPIVDDAAPARCTLDRECGTFGPCLNHDCWPMINGELVSCIQDADCSKGQACKPIGGCSNAPLRSCDASSATCGVDPVAGDLGGCVLTASLCLGSNDCRPAAYERPAQAIVQLPAGRDQLLGVITTARPREASLTPTGPALTGAIQLASAWARTNPSHQVVTVLATDGLPTLKTNGEACVLTSGAEDVTAVIDVAAAGSSSSPSIATFVIGVIGKDEVDMIAPGTLDAIALAGGTARAFIVDAQQDVQAQFRTALNQIRARGLSCDLKVPAAETGKKVDYGRVNVRFDDGSGVRTLGYVKEAQNCAQDGGWYYDVDPVVQVPQRILTCPVTCEALRLADKGSVKIELGCRTKVVVR